MIRERLDPFLLPSIRREYLYDHVLLSWEAIKKVQRDDKFNARKALAACGSHIVAIDRAEELSAQESAALPTDFEANGYLYFLNQNGKGFGSGYPCLMKRLRDTVAHGHYTSEANDWIKIRHVFNERTHIFGHLEMTKLIALVEFMNTSDDAQA